jgi:hypothetical protein
VPWRGSLMFLSCSDKATSRATVKGIGAFAIRC